VAEDLTIIVIALLGGEALSECVAAAREQSDSVLVVTRDGTVVDEEGRKVGKSERAGIPAKRRAGVELATTPLVALIEDTVIPDRGWAKVVRAAFRKSIVACGGPVKLANSLPGQTRALALSEYGRYNEHRPAGEMTALPGCNFAFRRHELLEAMRGSPGLADLDTFGRLRDRGGRLAWARDMAVTFAHPYPEGARLRTRFEHGRIYASSFPGLRRRIANAAKAFLLPAVLTARTAKDVGLAQIGSVSTLGWLILQHAGWAAGELVGATRGPTRQGTDEWR
jgi:hypothetical protein